MIITLLLSTFSSLEVMGLQRRSFGDVLKMYPAFDVIYMFSPCQSVYYFTLERLQHRIIFIVCAFYYGFIYPYYTATTTTEYKT
jgi:hypothetical protein